MRRGHETAKLTEGEETTPPRLIIPHLGGLLKNLLRREVFRLVALRVQVRNRWRRDHSPGVDHGSTSLSSGPLFCLKVLIQRTSCVAGRKGLDRNVDEVLVQHLGAASVSKNDNDLVDGRLFNRDELEAWRVGCHWYVLQKCPRSGRRCPDIAADTYVEVVHKPRFLEAAKSWLNRKSQGPSSSSSR